MTIATAKTTQNTKSRVSFADYLTYFDGSDTKYELVDSELVAMSFKTVDYRAKRTEYAARDIPDYWIVDPIEAKVSVLINSDGWYDVTEFFDSDRIISPNFPELQLTPQTIFSI